MALTWQTTGCSCQRTPGCCQSADWNPSPCHISMHTLLLMRRVCICARGGNFLLSTKCHPQKLFIPTYVDVYECMCVCVCVCVCKYMLYVCLCLCVLRTYIPKSPNITNKVTRNGLYHFVLVFHLLWFRRYKVNTRLSSTWRHRGEILIRLCECFGATIVGL